MDKPYIEVACEVRRLQAELAAVYSLNTDSFRVNAGLCWANHGLRTERDELRARVQQLLEANNAELARRRVHEADANQAHCETILLRKECRRLREHLCTLASEIEECHANGGEPIPEHLVEAMEAVFPAEGNREVVAAEAAGKESVEGQQSPGAPTGCSQAPLGLSPEDLGGGKSGENQRDLD